MDANKANMAAKWGGMMQRCYTERFELGRKHYFDKGIRVDSAWHDFETFYRDMGPCPEGMSLDRIDGSKNYGPTNCRWADRKTQANNRSNNVPIECDGEIRNLAEWASMKGLTPDTIQYRLKRGWAPRDAIFTPAYTKRSNQVIIEHEGRSGNFKQWSEWTGIAEFTLRNRVQQYKWPIQRALTEPARQRKRDSNGTR